MFRVGKKNFKKIFLAWHFGDGSLDLFQLSLEGWENVNNKRILKRSRRKEGVFNKILRFRKFACPKSKFPLTNGSTKSPPCKKNDLNLRDFSSLSLVLTRFLKFSCDRWLATGWFQNGSRFRKAVVKTAPREPVGFALQNVKIVGSFDAIVICKLCIFGEKALEYPKILPCSHQLEESCYSLPCHPRYPRRAKNGTAIGSSRPELETIGVLTSAWFR